MIDYPNIDNYTAPRQTQIDWLLKLGIDIETMIRPETMRLAVGELADDGRFDVGTADADEWLVFPEPEDVIFWQPRSGQLATWNGRAFALGEEVIDAPETYSFDCHLNVFASPLQWLQAKRDGIVVLDWSRAFDRLRGCARIAVAESVLFQYRRHMKPPAMPETFVLTNRRRIAA